MSILDKLTPQQILGVFIDVYNERDKWSAAGVKEVVRHINNTMASMATEQRAGDGHKADI